VRTLLGILLLAGSLWGGWQFGKQRALQAEIDVATTSRSRTSDADGSDVVRAAEAWTRYREAVRLGVKCEGDVGPHPIAAAAALAVFAWYVLGAGIGLRGDRTLVGEAVG